MQTRARSIGLPEFLEYVRNKLRSDTDARVRHTDFGMTKRFEQFDRDPAGTRCELDRVGEQIPNDLLQAIGVSPNDAVQSSNFFLDAYSFSFARRTHGFNGRLNNAGKIHRLHVQT